LNLSKEQKESGMLIDSRGEDSDGHVCPLTDDEVSKNKGESVCQETGCKLLQQKVVAQTETSPLLLLPSPLLSFTPYDTFAALYLSNLTPFAESRIQRPSISIRICSRTSHTASAFQHSKASRTSSRSGPSITGASSSSIVSPTSSVMRT